MAKKKSGKAVNKSAAVRESLAKNPEATNSEVIEELAKKGITVTPAMISTIRSRQKKTAKKRPASTKRRGVKKRTAKKKVSRKKRTTTARADDTVTIAELEKASAYLKSIGDVDRAITLVKAVSKLQS